MSTIEKFFDSVRAWAAGLEGIEALVLVGSHARGTNGSDSDIDLVVLTSNPNSYLQNIEWASRFGREVEDGFALPEWAESTGGRAVLATGMRALLDTRGLL